MKDFKITRNKEKLKRMYWLKITDITSRFVAGLCCLGILFTFYIQESAPRQKTMDKSSLRDIFIMNNRQSKELIFGLCFDDINVDIHMKVRRQKVDIRHQNIKKF